MSTPRPSPANNDRWMSLPGELAAITCYFNPCEYRALKRNYLEFAATFRRHGVPLYSIELAFGAQPFFLAPGPGLLQIRGRDILWQKERLLNLVVERLPSSVDKVAWVDADVIFENSHWANEAARKLEHSPVVQLFSEAHHLNVRGARYESRTGIAYAVGRSLPWAQDFARVHPGFAWAARRDLLARHGLFDMNIIGAGDTMMVAAMFGWWNHPLIASENEAMSDVFHQWADPFFREVGGNVGFVDGSISHLWHGSLANRKYVERREFLAKGKFDPQRDVKKDPSGAWRWATDKPALHEFVRSYFTQRMEDS
jgi:hypothetical protein